MISPASHPSLRAGAICLALVGLLPGHVAAAQSSAPVDGVAPLPSFAWPRREAGDESRWAGSFARMTTGFEVASSKHFGSYAGPTLGFEGGRMWQDGNLVYGLVGGFDYLDVIGGGSAPRAGGLAFTRDFAGSVHVKVGTVLTPEVLFYTRLGAVAAHDNLRFGATSFSPSFKREDIAVLPDARVGVEWAVTDHLSVAVEAGVAGGVPRW